MKKFTLILILLSYWCHAQLAEEGFEGAWPPPGWGIYDNGIGTTSGWLQSNGSSAQPAFEGTFAAYLPSVNVTAGTPEDWLVTPLVTVPNNPQLRFYSRLTMNGDDGSIYQIRISESATQAALGDYTVLQTWTEPEINPTQQEYAEKVVDLPAGLAGEQVYIAFVMMGDDGDRWLIDNVKVIEKCNAPANLALTAAGLNTASIAWDNPAGINTWEIQIIDVSAAPANTGTIYNGLPPYSATGLLEDHTYKFYIKAHCDTNRESDWAGPFTFKTLKHGARCDIPIAVTSLPFYSAGNTSDFGDNYIGIPGANCNTMPWEQYLNGDDVVFAYTAASNGTIMAELTGAAPSSGLFVYDECTDIANTCLNGATVAGPGAAAVISNFIVTAGQTYYFVISSWGPLTQSTPFNLSIQTVNCEPPVGLPATGITTTSAQLSWTNPTGATSWEIVVQDPALGIPAGAGTTVTANPQYTAQGLTIATSYEYYVRASCGDGTFSPWSGPYVFSTPVCESQDQCNYTFVMTSTFPMGWGGGSMTISQNGIPVAVIGPDFTMGALQEVTIPLCDGIPFQLTWTSGGMMSFTAGVSIKNSFGQTIYTKPPGTGTVGSVLYTGTVDCENAACVPVENITVTNVTATTAVVSWLGPADGMWEYYVVEAGDPAPTPSAVGEVTLTNPVTVQGLQPDTQYEFYIKMLCQPGSTELRGPVAFTTLPTCPRPVNITASNIGETQMTVSWTETGTATAWEVYIVEQGEPAPTTATPGTPVTATTYTATGLTSGTVYTVYVRAVCAADDKSIWTLPATFNTSICPLLEQCVYTFEMKDMFGAAWFGHTMAIRQDGVVIRTLTGPSMADGSTPVQVQVALCAGMPFELYWNPNWFYPGSVEVIIRNPSGEIVYTKAPGAGTPDSLLYTGTTECEIITCTKPEDITVARISDTTAQLSWEETGTATAWEVVVVPAGSPAPTGSGTAVTTNPHLVEGLNFGEPYEYYVRSNCDNGVFSEWTGPYEYTIYVANDNCDAPITVPVNAGPECVEFVTGSVDVSSYSGIPVTCMLIPSFQDVWYQFTATSDTHIVSLNNQVGGVFYPSVLFGDCDALETFPCFQGEELILTELVPGDTYKILVFTQLPPNPAGGTSYEVCITTPPPYNPPTNDVCMDAITVPVNPTPLCTQSVAGTIGTTESWPPPSCLFMPPQYDVWYEFEATAETHRVYINNQVGTTFYHTVYAGDDCGNLIEISCGLEAESTVSGLVPGNIYKVHVFVMFLMDTTIPLSFEICVTTPAPIADNDTCSLAIPLPVNSGSICELTASGTLHQATPSPEPNECEFSENRDDVWFEFVAQFDTHAISLLNITGSTSNLFHTLYEGSDCNNLVQLYCSDENNSIAEGLTPGNTYRLRVYAGLSDTGSHTSVFDVCVRSAPNYIAVSNTEYSVPELVENFLVNSDCAVVSNITSSTGIDFGSTNNGIAYFNQNNSLFPLEEGVVLATGGISEMPGPVNMIDSSVGEDYFWPGDEDVAAVLATQNYLQSSHNGTVIEYDFVSLSSEYSFDFLFASYEYGDFQCEYADTIAIILTNLDDPEADPVNLGVIPETTIPVSVATIRDATYNGSVFCPSANVEYFASYNGPITGTGDPIGSPVGYHGYTVVMRAEAEIVPGQKYHIKFAIADYNDEVNNSAVFFANSEFKEPELLDLGPNLLVADGTALCAGDEKTIVSGLDPAKYTFEWYRDNELLEGETGANLLVTQPGVYTINARFVNIECVLTGTVAIEFYPGVEESTGNPVDLEACNATGFATFNLTSNRQAILLGAGNPGDYTVTFYRSQQDAENNDNPISNIAAFENTQQNEQQLFVRIVNNVTGCVGYKTFRLLVGDFTPDFLLPSDPAICSGSSATITIDAINFDPTEVNYSWTLDGNPVGGNTSSLTVTAGGVYEVTVNNSGCTATQSMTVTVIEAPVPDDIADATVCDSYTLPELTAGNSYYTGSMATGTQLAAGTVISTSQTIYVYAFDAATPDCAAENPFTVTVTHTPDVIVTQGCEEDEYILEVNFDDDENGNNPDNVTFAWENAAGTSLGSGQSIVVTAPGMYYVTVAPVGAASDCPIVIETEVTETSCLIPRGISPDGDGDNDSFDLSGLNVEQLSIFNRYGMEVYSRSNYTTEWHGQGDNGDELPTGTYYYMIERSNGERNTGWVYINRRE